MIRTVCKVVETFGIFFSVLILATGVFSTSQVYVVGLWMLVSGLILGNKLPARLKLQKSTSNSTITTIDTIVMLVLVVLVAGLCFHHSFDDIARHYYLFRPVQACLLYVAARIWLFNPPETRILLTEAE